MLSEAEHVQLQVEIDVDKNMQMYIFPGLHNIAHAVESCTVRERNSSVLRSHGCEIKNMNNYETNEGVQHIPGLAENYTSRSSQLQHFVSDTFEPSNQKELAEYVIGIGLPDENRDSGGDGRRIYIGFGRAQKKSERLCNVKMPTFNTKHLETLPPTLSIVIAKVLSFAQRRLNDFLGLAGENTVVDIIRSDYVRSKWRAFYNRLKVDVDWDFEFVDFNVSSEGKLLRHCDYKNDWRVGHDGCVVFSYSVNISDKKYRVVMVMTSRITVGAPFEKIHNSESLAL